ncbi:MAG: CPBP family intramembrane metalloprotease [Desulfobacula sp.]|nr:CPBP family intramembrane metalloprotease [Desulfobacula sp.]
MLKKLDAILEKKGAYTEPVPWNIIDITKFLIVYILTILFSMKFYSIFYFFCHNFSITKQYYNIIFLSYSIMYYILPIVIYFFYFLLIKIWILKKYNIGLKTLFQSNNKIKYFFLAIIISVVIGAPEFFIFLEYVRSFQMLASEISLFRFLFSHVLLASILAPIVEETVFKSFIYRALKKKIGVSLGILTTSILFTGLHFNKFTSPTEMLSTLFDSIAINIVYEKTGSLHACIFVHFLNNLTHSLIQRYCFL